MKNTPGNEPGEDLNVREVHGQIWRENAEPHELYQRIPWWLKHLIYAPLVIWGIWYLLIASGGFRWDEYIEGVSATQVPKEGPVADAAPPERDAVAEGEKVYNLVCSACHQPDGNGLPGAFPPLANSDWVQGDENRLALVVLHGLMGEITVNGQPWNSAMPPQGATLRDRQIADVLTYIRASWGNDAPPVELETVSALRTEHEGRAPWTQAELDSL
ncbi:cytochrome c [Roseibacillus persicicus]|uniref:c-type cytochrome n=1 Tax=Roseibacillus persicicus TaxID=454148 RepID=UPI00398A80E4